MNKYATFFERTLAFALDHMIYFVIVLFPLTKISNLTDLSLFFNTAVNIIIFLLIFTIIIFFLEIVMTAKFGATAGKLLMGLSVQKDDGSYPSFKEAFYRLTIGRALSGVFFGMGYFWIFKNDKKQAWHDTMGNFFVVKKYSYGWVIGLLLLIVFLVINIGLIVKSISSVL